LVVLRNHSKSHMECSEVFDLKPTSVESRNPGIRIIQFSHEEKKDTIANRMREKRGVRDGIVFIGVAQEKAQAFQGKKINGQFEFTKRAPGEFRRRVISTSSGPG